MYYTYVEPFLHWVRLETSSMATESLILVITHQSETRLVQHYYLEIVSSPPMDMLLVLYPRMTTQASDM